MQRRYENEVHEREKMELRLQMEIMRSERALPPGDRTDAEALQEQIAALMREVQELRQRIEHIEQKGGE